MGMEPQPGMFLRLPCRSCGAFAGVKLVRGKSETSCAKCGRKTEIDLSPQGSGWVIRTRPIEPPR